MVHHGTEWPKPSVKQALYSELLRPTQGAPLLVRVRRDRYRPAPIGEAESPDFSRASTCRGQVLDAIREVLRGRKSPQLTVKEVVEEMARRGRPYSKATIQVTIAQKMTTGHKGGTGTNDLERVSRGVYRLRVPPTPDLGARR